jgi:succinyl-diaminopimelate desuccinylase
MKSGVAVQLRLAKHLAEPNRDVTYVFYDHEEVEADKNGLGRVARNHPDWLAGDFAVLMEPTNATVEGGCQGTVRADVVLHGHRSHSARSWMGSNAIHAAGDLLQRLATYQAAEVEIDGLTYREGMNAVGITGGVAGNVIPDECRVTVNYRFAPDKSEDQAAEVVRRVLSGFEVEISDSAPGALPGLSHPAAAEFVAMVGREPLPKFGWTDVARFSALGVPAVNYGPGDPGVAHQREEYCDIAPIHECEQKMRAWLGA